ncbi:hypothetical protein QFC21_002842 [Naganishia friedmannii]|uniref:Uncharacterized protein n=1 Tax=Naganishia friedmannii TaxID=89922 RepID=A0ACC2VSX1_9TREE|nr:hypothetical protein QFC21_002842 [Naganishia friedmannii]
MAVTKPSIRGYQASPDVDWEGATPRLYQFRSWQTDQTVSTTLGKQSGKGSNQFSDYAKAHAFSNTISPSKSKVGLSPVSPVSSTSSYNTTFHDDSNTQLSIELNRLKPISLSPSLQSAAARAPPPLSALVNDVPRLAPFRPGPASSALLPHLPGPQELIKSTSQTDNVKDGAARSEFGQTTKIVPLPVTTTRPLPLIERKKTYKPPVVTLTADQYALRSTVTRVLGSNLYEPRTTRHPAISSIVFPSGPQASTTSAGNPFNTVPDDGPHPHMSTFSGPANIVPAVPPGFTSVPPGGRSRNEKKLIQEFLATQPLILQPVYQQSPVPLSVIPPGFTSNAPTGRSYHEGKRKKAPPTAEEIREEQQRQAELYHKALRDRPTQPAQPVNMPVSSTSGVGSRKGKSVKSQYKSSAQTESPAIRSVDREMTMESMDTLASLFTLIAHLNCDRPAICSFNPVHPLYEERILKGEITTDIICDKRFTRKSDCVRHERIHVNDRPFTCTMDGCNKSFIQRSALTVHIRTQFSRKFSLSKHFHSTHSDLPVPMELCAEPGPPEATVRNVNLDASALDSGSDLSSAPSSDDTDDEVDSDTSIHLLRETANGKLLKVYENDDAKGKHVKAYHPRREGQQTTTTTQLPPVVTAPSAKKRKYENAEFKHATSRYDLAKPSLQSGVALEEYVRLGPTLSTDVHIYSQVDGHRRQTRGAKLGGAVSATRDEIALPLGTIYGPATTASANNYEYPSRSQTMRPAKYEASTAIFRPTGNPHHQPVYLSMQTSGSGGHLYPTSPPTHQQTFTNHDNIRAVRDAPRSRIQGYQTETPLAMNTSKQSSAYTTAEYREHHIDNARSLSRRALLPVLTDNLDCTSPAGRTKQINSFDSAITMVDSPAESTSVNEEEEESKGMNL